MSKRSEISFRHKGRTVALSSFAPDRLLLDWLREEAGVKGTKEGCAEGDCGACTVVLCRPASGGRLNYLPVNACILLLGQIDGAELLTVEDLAEGETLHPVQQAMVDYHGSQCGFCTPGIVMSLFAHYQCAPATRETVNAVLAGNLCRCTGYRPIVDAALSVIDGAPGDRFARETAERWLALAGLPSCDLFVGDEMRFFAAPASEDALSALYRRHPDAVLLGGATDVGLWLTKHLKRLAKIIWLGRIQGFDAIEDSKHAVTFHAGATLTDAAPRLAELHPDLGLLMSRFGSAQVRASGTVGGNIANGSPIGDLAPALIAMGASIRLHKVGFGTAMPLEDFFVAYGKQNREPDQHVSSITVLKLGRNSAYRAYKVSKRFDEDISAVMGAFRFDLDGRRIVSARVAYGGMAATPKRAAACEAALAGVDLDDPATWGPAVAAIAKDFQPLTDMRATAAYRSEVAANLVKRALTEVSGLGAPTRLGDLRAAE